VTGEPEAKPLLFAARYSLAVLLPAFAVIVAANGWLRLQYLEYALLGSFAIYLAQGTTRRDRLVLLLATMVIGFCNWGREHLWSPQGLGYVLGLACIAAAGLRLTWVEADRRREAMETAAAVTLFPLVVAEALLVRRALKDAYDDSYDLYAFVVDQRLGGQLSFTLGQWFLRWPAMGKLFGEVYAALPFALGLLYAFLRRGAGPYRSLKAVVLLFTASILAVAGYLTVPVAGPRFVFASYPWSVPQVLPGDLRLLPLDSEIERNGVPSLHLASALLVWWNLRRLHLGLRLFTGLFLVGTAIATLGLGEHYVVDLVIALPFALALQAGLMASPSAPEGTRWLAVGLGTGLTLAWLAALRSAAFVFLAPTVLVAGLTAVSVILPFWQERRLWARAS
jgi:PAP2 superfamily